MKLRFLVESSNELEDRAKKHRKTDCKGALGWFANPGNPEAMDQFNNSVADNADAMGEELILNEDSNEDLFFYSQVDNLHIFTDEQGNFYDDKGRTYDSLEDLLDSYFPGEEMEIKTNEDLTSKDKQELKKVIDATDDEDTIRAFLKIKKDGIEEEYTEEDWAKKVDNQVWDKIKKAYLHETQLQEEADITEDNLDEYAINKLAVLYNKPLKKIRSKLLNREV